MEEEDKLRKEYRHMEKQNASNAMSECSAKFYAVVRMFISGCEKSCESGRFR
jgi:hypothetical protein